MGNPGSKDRTHVAYSLRAVWDRPIYQAAAAIAVTLALGAAPPTSSPLHNDVAQATCDNTCSKIVSILGDRSNAFFDLRSGPPDDNGASDGTVAITIDGYTCTGLVVSNDDSMTDNNGSDYRCVYGVPRDDSTAVFEQLRAGAQEAMPSSWDQWNEDGSDGQVWCAGPDNAHTLIVVDHFGSLVKLWVYAKPQLRANGFCSGS